MEISQSYGYLPVIETERLILRKLTFDDAEDIYEYRLYPLRQSAIRPKKDCTFGHRIKRERQTDWNR